MRRLLLDTHTFLWWLMDSPKLGERAKNMIMDNRNDVFVSAATGWEISIKKSLGKLEAPENLDAIVEDEGFQHLAISFFHAEQAGALPPHHRDPFDRMLVAQAQAEGLTIITQASDIAKYGVRIANASE